MNDKNIEEGNGERGRKNWEGNSQERVKERREK